MSTFDITPLFDIHAHYTPPSSPEWRTAMWQAMRREHFLAPAPYEWTLQSTQDYMDATGTAVQMLSNVPTDLAMLRRSNDFGAEIVAAHPDRFGLLAALPTDDPVAATEELRRMEGADGWAVTTVYNGHPLSDAALEPLWTELNERHAVVFMHPNAYAPAVNSLPTPLVEAPFDTGRTVVEMLYAGIFDRFPDITFVIAHCGGGLPLVAGRLSLLGNEAWVPNEHNFSRDDLAATLRRLWLDTAASGSEQQLFAGVTMAGEEHLVYGSDWGVPCTTTESATRNINALRSSGVLASRGGPEALLQRATTLFPRFA